MKTQKLGWRERLSADMQGPQVVGTAICLEDILYLIELLRSGEKVPFNVIELRMDHLHPHMRKILILLRMLRRRIPVILTARHELQGGKFMPAIKREEVALKLIPLVWAIDAEIEYYTQMRKILKRAHKLGVVIIGSAHEQPGGTPYTSFDVKKSMSTAYHDMQAKIFKFAAMNSDLVSITTLLHALNTELGANGHGRKVAVMSMDKKLCMALRLLLALYGSALNYGYITQQFMGCQWEAAVLRVRLDELIAAQAE